MKEQAEEIHALQGHVDELVKLRTEAAASARVLRWIWAAASFIGGWLLAWVSKDGR